MWCNIFFFSIRIFLVWISTMDCPRDGALNSHQLNLRQLKCEVVTHHLCRILILSFDISSSSFSLIHRRRRHISHFEEFDLPIRCADKWASSVWIFFESSWIVFSSKLTFAVQSFYCIFLLSELYDNCVILKFTSAEFVVLLRDCFPYIIKFYQLVIIWNTRWLTLNSIRVN